MTLINPECIVFTTQRSFSMWNTFILGYFGIFLSSLWWKATAKLFVTKLNYQQNTTSDNFRGRPIVSVQSCPVIMLKWNTTGEYFNIMQKAARRRKNTTGQIRGAAAFILAIAAFGSDPVCASVSQQINQSLWGDRICLKKQIWARSVLDSF